ncbi:MAG: isoleucine--tRNA ligase [Planctomycetales bacterium]|nr:isoleucine--tRNA ligase [Planctomycetales bacterium]
MFNAVPNNVSFPELETEILEFWKSNEIYKKSLQQREGAEPFVFFEGPPTANGLPHPGHCLTRAIKDVFPRYRTMRGYRCQRKAGWDTHGLPVEVEVCKELGIHSKEEIEAYGVEPFIHKCQQSVWRYMQEWERLTDRLGFWVDLDEAYVTYHQSYVESVWWCLKNLFDRDLLYEGHKIVWWWAQGGTALSSGEVGQGYREVADPSVYVLFPLLDQPKTAVVAWTTTPWTLPSNQFAAVHPDLDYVKVSDPEVDTDYIVAAALQETLAGKLKRELTVVETMKGSDLIGLRYTPPFDYYYKEIGETTGKLKSGVSVPVAWRIVAADFVTTDSGTGVVHQAPAFGEVDHDVLVAEQAQFEEGQGPELICAVGPDGKFTDVAGEYEGRWVKECDRELTRSLRDRGILLHQEQYLHDYPFCWRAEQDPLIQYPRRSWFIRTTKFKDKMIANNQAINWQPNHIKDGRFGNFLESNVDWALSRERYWGTPLPIWKCEETHKMVAIGSYEELLTKPGVTGGEVWEKAKQANPDLPDDLRVHKPYIDEITFDSPYASGARMRRVPEVIDCWFDSGAMPFAQWGYPHQRKEEFNAQWPADFISEAIDQTRGWFYSLLAISTLMFGDDESEQGQRPFPHPFRNCIVLGLMLSEWWEDQDGKIYLTDDSVPKDAKAKNLVGKMSKSKRNYREPNEIFDRYGADALRWYFFANQSPWTSIRYSERAIKDSIPEFLLRLWNVYSFFVIYANIDGFDPADGVGEPVTGVSPDQLAKGETYRPAAERSEIDRWVLSELNRTVGAVIERMDAYDNYAACGHINSFVDSLSNWYVRLSRDRYWSSDKQDLDKLDAYWTLYECLITTAQMIAPFVPFLAESLWKNLTSVFGEGVPESVHLCDYPVADAERIDETLSQQVALAREIVSMGRSARMTAKLKVRQPLQKVEVILNDQTHRQWLESHDAQIRKELNVKSVEFAEAAEEYISYQVRPNFKLLGPVLGKDMPQVKKLLMSVDGGKLLAELNESGKIVLTLEDGRTVELNNEQIEVRLEAKEGWAAAQGKNSVVVLATELTPELLREGMARDLVRYIQDCRREMNCDYTDRISVSIDTDSDDLKKAIDENRDHVCSETLTNELKVGPVDDGAVYSIGDIDFRMKVVVAS